MDESRLKRAERLAGQMGQDPDVRLIVASTCRERGVASMGHLADAQPDVFDELCSIVDDMVDQLPTVLDRE